MSVLRGTVAGALTTVAFLFLIGGGAFVFLMEVLEEVRIGAYQAVLMLVGLLGALAGGAVGGWQARAGGAGSRGRIALSGLLGPVLLYVVGALVSPGQEGLVIGLLVTLLGAAAGAWAASRRAPATE